MGTERIAALAGEGGGEAGAGADKTEATPAMDETVTMVAPVGAERAVTVRSDVALMAPIDEIGSTWMLISR